MQIVCLQHCSLLLKSRLYHTTTITRSSADFMRYKKPVRNKPIRIDLSINIQNCLEQRLITCWFSLVFGVQVRYLSLALDQKGLLHIVRGIWNLKVLINRRQQKSGMWRLMFDSKSRRENWVYPPLKCTFYSNDRYNNSQDILRTFLLDIERENFLADVGYFLIAFGCNRNGAVKNGQDGSVFLQRNGIYS